MPSPYSEDLRIRIVNAYCAGEGTYDQLARRFGVGRATVNRYLQRLNATGDIRPDDPGGGRVALIGVHNFSQFYAMLKNNPDCTVEDFCDIWRKTAGTKISRAAMLRALHRFGHSFKKKSFRASEQLTARVQSLRSEFASKVKDIPPERMVFLDESGSNVAMATARGWGHVGRRLERERPASRGKNITMAGAIRMTGPVVLKTMEGAMTSRRFVDWAKILASRLGDGDVVLMDNLGAHHAPEARAALERHGVRVVYLTPYSPDLNPIEMVWSVVKSKLRRAARRTVARLKKSIVGIWASLRHREFSGLFASCGYA